NCSFCQTQHLAGNRTQQQAGKATATMATNKDKLTMLFFCCLNNAVCNIEVGHGAATCLDTGSLGTVEDRLDMLLCLFGRFLVVVFIGNGICCGHTVKPYSGGKWLGDIQGHNFGPDCPGK